jgi:transcription initiation factor TFIID subunit 7
MMFGLNSKVRFLNTCKGGSFLRHDLHMKSLDSRRATFHIGKNAYTAKLVDLPCIIESQKTFDNKHMFKVADISQVSDS